MTSLTEARPLEYYLELNYPITVYRAEEGGYVAEIEDLPGCITEGETLEEALQRIEDVRNAWMETAYEDGIEIPLPRTDEEYSGKFMIRIPKYLHRRLAEQAKREGVSLNQLVGSILSSGASVQDAVGNITAELAKITKYFAAQKMPLLYFATHRDIPSVWSTMEAEWKPAVHRLRGIESREQIAV